MTVLSNIITPSNVLTTTNTATVTNKTFGDNPTFSGGTANGVTFLNGSKVLTSGSALTFDGATLGVGVAGSAWDTLKAVDIGSGGTVWGTAAQAGLGSNVYYGSGGFRYKATNVAAALQIDGNVFKWFTAASGTAGNAISFTQAMTLTAAGKLGVGTTAPDAGIDSEVSSGNAYRAYKSTTGGFTAYRLYTANENVIGTVGVTSTNDTFYLGYTSTPVLTWNQNCVGVGGTTPSTSGAGITFPATQSASSNANTLDDYEEGTWTPDLTVGFTVVGATTLTGTYTKIGNTVFVRGTLQAATSLTSAGGNTRVTGFPFTSSASTGVTFARDDLSYPGTGFFNGTTAGLYNPSYSAGSSTVIFTFSYTV